MSSRRRHMHARTQNSNFGSVFDPVLQSSKSCRARDHRFRGRSGIKAVPPRFPERVFTLRLDSLSLGSSFGFSDCRSVLWHWQLKERRPLGTGLAHSVRHTIVRGTIVASFRALWKGLCIREDILVLPLRLLALPSSLAWSALLSRALRLTTFPSSRIIGTMWLLAA